MPYSDPTHRLLDQLGANHTDAVHHLSRIADALERERPAPLRQGQVRWRLADADTVTDAGFDPGLRDTGQPWWIITDEAGRDWLTTPITPLT